MLLSSDIKRFHPKSTNLFPVQVRYRKLLGSGDKDDCVKVAASGRVTPYHQSSSGIRPTGVCLDLLALDLQRILLLSEQEVS